MKVNTMSIDQKIKASLQQEQQHVDQRIDTILSKDDGLFARLGATYQGGMQRWMWFSTLLAVLLSAAFIYAGYRFFVATNVSDQVFWAVWFIVGLMMQIAVKLWMFMEMNRTSIIREIKRTESLIMSQDKKATN